MISDNVVGEVARLKAQDGGDIVQYGFGQLSYTLLAANLIDELRLWVHPFFVGAATTADLMFRSAALAQFTLTETTALDSGIVILSYRAAGE